MNHFKARTLSTSALICTAILFGAGLAAPAFAQSTPAAAEEASSEIVVTARKRSEGIQTVPISITALSAQDLTNRNISNFNDLANSTPGVAITSISGGNVQNIYLRGLAPGNTANDLNVEANVGVFINGIYQASRNTLDMISVLDLGQIEIAKGPQSALFGRSTFAGALSIATKRPSRDFEANMSATVGEDEDYRVRGSISGPLAEGLYARLSAGYLTYDGFGKNAANPKDNLGGTEKYAVNASLEYAPTDNFSAVLSGFMTHSETEISPLSLLPFSSFNCGNKNAASGVSLLYCGQLQAKKVSDVSPGIQDSVAKTRQVSLSLDWKLDGVQIVSVSGYGQGRNRAFNDYDGTSTGLLFGVCSTNPAVNCGSGSINNAPVVPGTYTRFYRSNLVSTAIERVNYFSQEIRFQSDNSSSPFQWLFGGNYYQSNIPITAGGIGSDGAGLAANERLVQLPITGTVPATGVGAYDFTVNGFLVNDPNAVQLFGSATAPYAKARNKTMSIFGSLGYKFGDVRINAEGRYNIDRKQLQLFTITNGQAQPNIYVPIPGTSAPSTAAFTTVGAVLKRTFESFTPRFTIDYQASRELFLYASAAKGVRSGGFNGTTPSATGILASEVPFDEESNWTYEAGVKSNWLNNRVILNGSIFFTDWKNAQVSAFTANPNAGSTVPRIVRNAGNVRAKGFELLADVNVTSMLGLGGSVTYSDVKFREGAYDASQVAQCRTGTTPATYGSAPGCPSIIAVTAANGTTQYVPSLKGLRPPRSVKWQWNAHATANIPLSDEWKVVGRVDVNYTGPTYSNLINTAQFGKRTLTNFRLGLQGERYGLSIWGNNIFDKTYVVNSINQPRAAVPFGGLSVPEIYLGEGRRVGLTGTVKF